MVGAGERTEAQKGGVMPMSQGEGARGSTGIPGWNDRGIRFIFIVAGGKNLKEKAASPRD